MPASKREAPWEPGELRVLLVDDEPDVLFGLELLARSLGADVETAASGEQALESFSRRRPHVVISDISMPGGSGLELLEAIQRLDDSVLVVLITGFGTIDTAVAALHAGATHFIAKPFDNEEILSALRRYGREALVNERVRDLRHRHREGQRAADAEQVLIAEDPKMREMLDLVHHVAATPMSVLIEGESGTGKEQIARRLHSSGTHRDRAFLAVNTAALPDTLLESELFGHRRGAFTGADSDRKGLFEQAAGGTVFLDEVGLMSHAFQERLLRVLQEKTITPLGTTSPVRVDFRLVAATSRDLRERIRRHEFHADLFFRLAVVTIHVPPLRERPADIAPLAAHFLGLYGPQLRGPNVEGAPRLGEDALRELESHDWPGNVRELENSIQRALVLSRGGVIRAHHLGLDQSTMTPWMVPLDTDLSYDEGKKRALEHFQRRFIQDALRRAHGNVTRAAESCGLTRAALQRILRTLGVERESFLEG